MQRKEHTGLFVGFAVVVFCKYIFSPAVTGAEQAGLAVKCLSFTHMLVNSSLHQDRIMNIRHTFPHSDYQVSVARVAVSTKTFTGCLTYSDCRGRRP